MQVLITGVAGFIGSNLAHKLLEAGHSVVGIDNFSFGSKRNIQPFVGNKHFTFIEGDVRNAATVQATKCDVIVHLASQKIPRYSTSFHTLEDNYLMLKNVIQKALADKVKLVFASTSDVYGKNPDIPFAETSNLVMGPTNVKRWAYAVSKMYSEHVIQSYNAEFGLEYTIMRFFGSYGPNQNLTWWGGPQSVFIQLAIEDKTLEVHGEGTQTRTFTFVEDTVQGVIRCMFEPNSKNDIFNIASEPTEEVQIVDLAKLCWRLVRGENSIPKINLIPYSTFGNYEDVLRRVPSIDKIKKMLGYQPQFSLAEGLAKTVAWQKSLQ